MHTLTLNRPKHAAQTTPARQVPDRLERLARWWTNHQEAQRVWATVEATRMQHRNGL